MSSRDHSTGQTCKPIILLPICKFFKTVRAHISQLLVLHTQESAPSLLTTSSAGLCLLKMHIFLRHNPTEFLRAALKVGVGKCSCWLTGIINWNVSLASLSWMYHMDYVGSFSVGLDNLYLNKQRLILIHDNYDYDQKFCFGEKINKYQSYCPNFFDA